MQPHRKQKPCRVCGGHREMKPGAGERCWGFLSDDGSYAHCSREEFAGSIERNPKTEAYPHRMTGPCKCGTTHGDAVVELGEARSAQVVATYDYRNESGELLYQVVRKHPKTFRQRRPDGAGGWLWNLEGVAPSLYRLPDVIRAVGAGDAVYIVEGEKDVEALESAGCVATCNSGGAGKWRADFGRYFQGSEVVIVRDRDKPGEEHAREVFRSIRKIAKSIRVVEAKSGKDAADHLSAGLSVAEFLPVWPLDDLRESDPVQWKRSIVRRSVTAGDPFREMNYQESLQRVGDPHWPTGLQGYSMVLPNFRGVTILTGPPSSGKSYLAIASACEAARRGWDVLYLASEMGEGALARRFSRFCGSSALPPGLRIVTVNFGADIEALVDLVQESIGERNLLVVMDSISSYVDQASVANSDDVHGIGPLKQMTMWALNVKRMTDGAVSFLLLSEANKEGRTKGRFGDHKADLVVSMATDEQNPSCKRISVVKGWEYQTGEVGLFGVDVETSRLEKI